MKKYILLMLGIMILMLNCASPEQETAHGIEPGAETAEPEHEEDSDHDHLHLTPEIIREKGIRTGYPEVSPFVKEGYLTGVVGENRRKSREIHTPVRGYVGSMIRDLGDEVAAGDALCTLYSPEFLDMKADYARAYMDYVRDAKDFTSARSLKDQNAIRQKEFVEREAEYKSSMSRLLALEGRLRGMGLSRQKLEGFKEALDNNREMAVGEFLAADLVVRSPVRGTITHQDFLPGQPADPDVLLYRVSDLALPWVDFQAGEEDLPYLKPGQSIRVRRHREDDRRFTGTVRSIAPALDPEIRTVTVRVEVQNENRLLKPGMYVTGHFSVSEPMEELAVPESAVVRIGETTGLFVSGGDGYEFVPVQVLKVDSDRRVFFRGLALDAEVVVSGAWYLKALRQLSDFEGEAHAGHSH